MRDIRLASAVRVIKSAVSLCNAKNSSGEWIEGKYYPVTGDPDGYVVTIENETGIHRDICIERNDMCYYFAPDIRSETNPDQGQTVKDFLSSIAFGD